MAAMQEHLIGDDSAIFKDKSFSPNIYCYRLRFSAFDKKTKKIKRYGLFFGPSCFLA